MGEVGGWAAGVALVAGGFYGHLDPDHHVQGEVPVGIAEEDDFAALLTAELRGPGCHIGEFVGVGEVVGQELIAVDGFGDDLPDAIDHHAQVLFDVGEEGCCDDSG